MREREREREEMSKLSLYYSKIITGVVVVTTFRGLASLIYNLGKEIGFFMGGISTVGLVEMPPLQSRVPLISILKFI